MVQVFDNKGQLDSAVSAGGVVVVDLWADWCGPCKQYGPIFEKVGEQMKDQAIFGKVDVDSAKDIATAYNVVSIPTTLIFANGELVDRIGGPMMPRALTKKVESQL